MRFLPRFVAAVASFFRQLLMATDDGASFADHAGLNRKVQRAGFLPVGHQKSPIAALRKLPNCLAQSLNDYVSWTRWQSFEAARQGGTPSARAIRAALAAMPPNLKDILTVIGGELMAQWNLMTAPAGIEGRLFESFYELVYGADAGATTTRDSYIEDAPWCPSLVMRLQTHHPAIRETSCKSSDWKSSILS